MITDRNLRPGDRLVAMHKGTQYHATVVAEGGRVVIAIETDAPQTNGVRCASVSQAAGLITGTSVNGWRFWSLASGWEGRRLVNAGMIESATTILSSLPDDPAEAVQTIEDEIGRLDPIMREPGRTPADRRAAEHEIEALAQLKAEYDTEPETFNEAPAPTRRRTHDDEPCGQALATLNICGECRGTLRAPDGHYHERMGRTYVGAEPGCCACRGDGAVEA